MNRITALVSVCALGAGTSAFGATETLYGCEYPGYLDLSSIDQTTGELTSVGPTGWGGLTDITSDTRPASFQMWAVDAQSMNLVTIDPTTGAGTGSVVLNAPNSIVSIAFDVVSGKLYGNSAVGWGAPHEALYEINPANGNCTYIGRITFDNVYALGFDQNGTLFGIADVTDDLISINLSNGNGSKIADLPQLSGYDLASRPSDDVMFLAMDDYPGTLATIDTGTGAITQIGPFHNDIHKHVNGLAFGPAIPAPGAAAVAVLFGAGAIRRQARR